MLCIGVGGRCLIVIGVPGRVLLWLSVVDLRDALLLLQGLLLYLPESSVEGIFTVSGDYLVDLGLIDVSRPETLGDVPLLPVVGWVDFILIAPPLWVNDWVE